MPQEGSRVCIYSTVSSTCIQDTYMYRCFTHFTHLLRPEKDVRLQILLISELYSNTISTRVIFLFAVSLYSTPIAQIGLVFVLFSVDMLYNLLHIVMNDALFWAILFLWNKNLILKTYKCTFSVRLLIEIVPWVSSALYIHVTSPEFCLCLRDS